MVMKPISAETAPPDAARFRARLLAWYRRHHRDLPWRRAQHDPYAQWLAEMMLHQTQVTTVIPYYERFMRRFPTVGHLAAARREEVLDMWSGLGYYRRAHQLHDAAIMVVTSFAGRFPGSVPELMQLPGVGRYTAGAIASIAFDVRAPVLDGNVKRVLLRIQAVRQSADQPDVRGRLWKVAAALLPRTRCGEFNQSLMELGARVCTPRAPACDRCPVARFCRAKALDLVRTIPAARKRTAHRELVIQCVACVCDGAVLFRRRPPGGLWAGMWELPSTESRTGGMRVARSVLPETVQPQSTRLVKIGSVDRQLTHRSVRIVLHRLDAPDRRQHTGYQWFDLGEPPPLPRAFAEAVALLQTATGVTRNQRATQRCGPGARSMDQPPGRRPKRSA